MNSIRGGLGPQGFRGPQGPQGPTGPPGLIMTNGDTILIGATGPKGEKGLKGDKGTNDIVFIKDYNNNLKAAIDATPSGGLLMLGAGIYISDRSDIYRSNITICGQRMPFYNSDNTGLIGGTIIQGTFHIIGDNVTITNLGIDCGSIVCTQLGINYLDCLNMNNPRRQNITDNHYNCVVKDVITICNNSTSPVHNFLLEGLSDSYFENLHAKYGQWGIVMKTIKSTANGLYAYDCSQAGFTFKSDNPPISGMPALNSTVSNVYIDNSNTINASNCIFIYAATYSLNNFVLNNFITNGGNVGLKLVCDNKTNYINLLSNVIISNGTITNSNIYGFETYGAINEVIISNIGIKGTVSNKSIYVDNNCLGIQLNNINTNESVSNSQNIYLAGRFSFNNLNSYINGDLTNPSTICCYPDPSIKTLKNGNYIGNLVINNISTTEWIPTFQNLIVNGSPLTIWGSYEISGKFIEFRVTIGCPENTTYSSGLSGLTYIDNLPFQAKENGTLTVINGFAGGGGVGLINAYGKNAYLPSWTNFNNTYTIVGRYEYTFNN